eukprot:403360838
MNRAYLRSDVLYKSIARDMRKFYIKDFNLVTDFITMKGRKDKSFFIEQVILYIVTRFPQLNSRLRQDYFSEEFKSQLHNHNIKASNNIIENNLQADTRASNNIRDIKNSLTNYLNQDPVLFFASLIYPKELWNFIQSKGNPNNQQTNGKEMFEPRTSVYKIEDERVKFYHSSLYNFSLDKLYQMINEELFAFFYGRYFEIQVLQNNIIEQKSNMNSNFNAYVMAFNLLLRLSQKTLLELIEFCFTNLGKSQSLLPNDSLTNAYIKATKIPQKKLELFKPVNSQFTPHDHQETTTT